MFCSQCGNKVDERTPFCPFCGKGRVIEYLKEKGEATPLEMGTTLLELAWKSNAESEYSERFRELEVDPTRALAELLYLRVFSVDHAAFTALESNPARDAVLEVYRAHLDVIDGIAGSPDRLREGRHKRVLSYAKAFESQHHLGPGWTVGCKFAEFCGQEKDLGLVMLGAIAFASTSMAVGDFLKSVRATSKPPNEEIAGLQADIRQRQEYLQAGFAVDFGKTLAEESRLDEAIASFRKAIALKSDYAPAHYNLGLALYKKGDLAGAIAEWQTAIRLEPGSPLAYYNLGVAFAERGDLDRAIDAYRNAVRLKPDYADAHNNLGSALKSRIRPC